MRRQFNLSQSDIAFLNGLGLEWEALSEGGSKWVLIHDYTAASGLEPQVVDLAICIDPGYPTAQLDMAFFCPPLKRKDGRTINALSDCPLDGRVFQRWSRHRTEASKWRPGEDDLESHYLYVAQFLQRETGR